MSEINPYESPREFDPAVVPEPAKFDTSGLWREGDLLVMHKWATLPDRCVKTNRPAQGCRVKRTFYQSFYLRNAIIQVPVNPRLHAQCYWMLFSAIALTIAGMTMILIEPLFTPSPSNDLLFGIGGFMLAATLIILAIREGWFTPLSAVKITSDHIWLSGVHPDFLAELPERPDLR